MTLIKMSEELSLVKNQTVGVITNYSTEQFLKRDFLTKKMNIEEYEELIEKNRIEVVFIEEGIYETDHQWYNFEINEIINYLSNLNVNIIIIKSKNSKISKSKSFPSIYISETAEEISRYEDSILMPVMMNEKIYNPVGVKKTLDVLFLKFDHNEYSDDMRKYLRNVKPNFEEIITNDIVRSVIKRVSEKAKEAKVLYIYYTEKMNSKLLRFLELAAVLQNTVLIIDPKYKINMKHGFKSPDEESNTNYIQTFTNDGLFLDKKIISENRIAFLKNTLIQYSSFEKILTGNFSKSEINISVITSTKRKWTIPDYIERLNNQKYVKLQVVLLSHGFVFSSEEIKELKKKAQFNLTIIDESENTVFGACLNKCIDLTTEEFFTKMDDDDFYYPNYLIDSWIAQKHSGADIVGKYSQFVYLEESDLTIQRFVNLKNRYSKYVAGATIFCRTEFVKRYRFSDIPKAVDSDIIRRVLAEDGIIYCGHPYEFCIFRADDKEEHTWQVEDTALLRSADVLFYSNPEQSLTIN